MVNHPSDFQRILDKMPGYLQELEQSKLYARNELKELPFKRGVYVFYENGKPLYVGRSDRLKERIQEHGQKSSDSASTPLATGLVRKKLGKSKKELSGRQVEKLPCYADAKASVRAMGVRAVEIRSCNEQHVFELYAHLALGTPHNDFCNN